MVRPKTLQCMFTVIDKEEMQDCVKQVEFLWTKEIIIYTVYFGGEGEN